MNVNPEHVFEAKWSVCYSYDKVRASSIAENSSRTKAELMYITASTFIDCIKHKEAAHFDHDVQWSWWTAHNCVYPCDEAVCGFYAQRRNKVVRPDATWDMKFCETRYPSPGQKPQMFRNCAGTCLSRMHKSTWVYMYYVQMQACLFTAGCSKAVFLT